MADEADHTSESSEIKSDLKSSPSSPDNKLNTTETLNTSVTTASEESEYETLEEDNGNDNHSCGSDNHSYGSDNHSYGSDRSSRSRHSLRSLEEGELSGSIVFENEREDGDGEEESSVAKDKKLDDDEDRRNPQYIPKKGTFYEHDDRTTLEETGTQDDEKEGSTSGEKPEDKSKDGKQTAKKGKVWTEKADKWKHDLYIDDDQKPKSTQELIDTYGYDIRNEDAPPKARRRRRYGRGPNKYTRNWEDEDAYNRPTAGTTPRKPFQNNREEFPDLDEQRPRSKSRDKRRGRGSERKSPQNSVDNSKPQLLHGKMKVVDKQVERERKNGPASDPHSSRKDDPSRSQSESNGFVSTGLYVESNVPGARGGIGRGFRGRGTRPTMEFTASRGRARRISPPFENKSPGGQGDSLKHAADVLSTDFAHMFVNDNTKNSGSNNVTSEVNRGDRRMPVVQQERPPRMQDNIAASSNRSKRYSTQRQRSLPETAQPPAYTMGYYGPSPQLEGYPPGPVFNEGVPVAPPPVTSPPMQMVTFLPPGPPPPPGPAPPYPPPPLINYVTPPPYALPIPPPNAPAEIFQGQGGITYYNAQSQAVVPRQTPPRRVKLAIPIVPPPEKAPRGRGRNREPNSPSAQTQQEVNTAVS